MGNRAEKAVYGSMKAFTRLAKEGKATKPQWRTPKRREWKPRHVHIAS